MKQSTLSRIVACIAGLALVFASLSARSQFRPIVSVAAGDHIIPMVSCIMSGSSPVTFGDTYTFTLSGTCSGGATGWTVSCGTIVSSGSMSATVYFNNNTCGSSTVTAQSNGVNIATKTVTVNQPPALNCGAITTTSQSINYNTTPAIINASSASGGDCQGDYSYNWYYSTNGSTWTGISGAFNQNYQPGPLTTTTYFKRSTNCNTQAGYTSNIATVIVYPPVVAGSITPPTQTINNGAVPGGLSISGCSGGNGSYDYQWQSSPNNSFTSPTVVGSNSSTYNPPALTATTYYRVAVSSNGSTPPVYANYVTVNVWPPVNAGSINPAGESINYNTAPDLLSDQGVTGGNGSYSYQWYSNASGTFQPISGATSSTYQAPALTASTSYEVVVTSNGASATSSPITITVYPPFSIGSISPSGATINYNAQAPTLSVSPSGGSGLYTYQWYSNASGTFQPIDGASQGSYSPGSMTTTTSYEVLVGNNGLTGMTSPVTINVNPAPPPLTAGAIIPGNMTIPSGTNPGSLTCTSAGGGACGGSYGYQWQSSTDGQNWSDVSGAASSTFNPGAVTAAVFYRVRQTCGTGMVYTDAIYIGIGSVSNLNYIRERDFSRPGLADLSTANEQTDPFDVQQRTTYLDGLGRPIQMVNWQASPQYRDVVTIHGYDAFDRESVNYLPYVASSSDGNYKSNPFPEQNSFNAVQYPSERFFAGTTTFEASELGRTQVTTMAGNSWSGLGRGLVTQYLINTAADSVCIWTIGSPAGSLPVAGGFYSPGQLRKKVSYDENGHQSVVFVDMDGKTVLRKVQSADAPATGHYGWLCTYYVYDDFLELRFVLEPKAVEWVAANNWTLTDPTVINELCFQYLYDQKGRPIVKKVPGSGEVWTVYDALDRVVMMQDANLRGLGKWLVSEYDNLNRPTRTGLLTDGNNRDYHAALADNSTNYPAPGGTAYEVLTQTFYDDYSWVSSVAPSLGTSLATGVAGDGAFFNTQYNSYPAYAMPISQGTQNIGQKTGIMTKVLGTASQYLYSVHFYDERDRLVQTRTLNFTGGIDTVTTQYNFAGKPLQVLQGLSKPTNTAQSHRVLTRSVYDAALRPKSTWKRIDGASADQLIDSMQYDELGRLRAKYLGNNLDSLVYDYNIRGWVTGINKAYLNDSVQHYFGMELAYDNAASLAGTTYSTPTFNGNIAGTIWRSAGDGVKRKYDFAYDNADRLLGAAYLDNHDLSGWGKSAMDYTVDSISYDANGNILSMYQHGFKQSNHTGLIDLLTYGYEPNSNKLSKVVDGANDPGSMLGDFHYSGSKQDSDYHYDANGNLSFDNNKAIDNIVYNHLNLPQQVHMNGKGNIIYTFDASGDKLQKQVFDSASGLATTTLYMGTFQYQRRTPLVSPGGGVDTLQFVGHEEGRARWAFHKYTNGDSAYAWEYDFIEKDHLGDTRVLLTQERDTANYMATMETQYRATEDSLFYGIDACALPTPAWFPTLPTGPQPNNTIALTDGYSYLVGPSKLLKVMSGDNVNIGVYAFVSGAAGQIPPPTTSFPYVMSVLGNGLVSMTGGSHGGYTDLSNPSSPVFGALTTFLSTKDTNTTVLQKAYLNWMLLDNQLNYVSSSGQSGAVAVYTNNLNTLAANIPIKTSGYLYIWVSNESTRCPVFFDNLSIQHIRGPLLEENHYYPFGLSMAGISDKALIGQYPENKYRYNKGSELQNKEFGDGTGLEMYETHYRMLDPQLGRWWQIDPKSEASIDPAASVDDETVPESLEMLSPYESMDDNPILHNDPNGDCPICALVGGAIGGLVSGGIEAGSQLIHSGHITSWKAVGAEALHGVVTGAVAGATGGASLLVSVGANAGANIVGGAISRAVQGKGTTLKDVLVDGAVGGGMAAAGKVVGKLTEKGLDKLSNQVKGKLGETATKIKYAMKGFKSEGNEVVRTGGRTPTGRVQVAKYDHSMKNVFTGKKLTVESKFNTAGLTPNQVRARPNVTTPGGLIVDRTTSNQIGKGVGAAVTGTDSQVKKD